MGLNRTYPSRMNRYRFSKDPHAHFLDNKPLLGTSTITGVINKELSWWASGMCASKLGWMNPKRNDEGKYLKGEAKLKDRMNDCLVRAGDTLTKIKMMTVAEYFDLLANAYKAHNEKKESRAQEGTDLHDSAEEWIKGQITGVPILLPDPKLKSFIDWAEKNVKRFLFSEVCCFSEKLWTGGKTDFGYENMEGLNILSDLKSREKAYFSDFAQIGGYGEGIAENGIYDDNGNKLFDPINFDGYAVFPLTEKFTEPVVRLDTMRWRDTFKFCTGLYKSKNDWGKENGEWK